jgi:glycosyltransferase involved in cell wall biosynthesis
MKILHVTLSMSAKNGGVPIVVEKLTEKMAQQGLSVSILTSSNNEEHIIYPEKVKLINNKESFLSKIWKGHSFTFKKTAEKEVLNCDIIHIHGTWHYPQYIAYQLAKKYKKPFILSPLGSLDPWCLNYKSFKKKIFSFLIQNKILKEASFIHALTEKENHNILNFNKNCQTVTIPAGLDIENKERNSFATKTIVFLGRLHPIKGLDILAEAFGIIKEKRKDVQLLIIGSDENNYKKKIEKILKNNNSLDQTIFTGLLTGSDKIKMLCSSDIFVLPSYSETFGLSILEAMSCKLPVIISNQCNIASEVKESCSGIIVNLNKKDLAEAIIELLDNKNLAKEMGENGHKLIQEKFNWNKITNKMIDLYKKAISSKIK